MEFEYTQDADQGQTMAVMDSPVMRHSLPVTFGGRKRKHGTNSPAKPASSYTAGDAQGATCGPFASFVTSRSPSPSPSSPGSPHSSSTGNGTGKRAVVSNKRARLVASHPLSRPGMVKAASTSSVPTLAGGPQGPFPHHLLGRSPLYHLQPSPPPALHAAPGSLLLQHKQRGLLASTAATVGAAGGGGAAACVSCKRVATSTLQLAKFKRCQLCGLSSCAICARVCGGRPWASSSSGSASGGSSGGNINSNGRRKGRPAAYDRDQDQDEDGMTDGDTVNGNADAVDGDGDAQIGTPARECGRSVCRECSVESSAGIPHCYQCTFPPELPDDGMSSAVPETATVALQTRSYSEGDDTGISIEDYDFAV